MRDLMETSEFSQQAIVVADNPGCGKTVYLNKLAMDIKRNNNYFWVSLVELGVKEQEKHLEKLLSEAYVMSGEVDVQCLKDLLFEMVRSGDLPLERKLFHHITNMEYKAFVLFDGFDEICPKYKAGVVAFLKTIKIHLRIRIVVTTRLHDRYDLEKTLGVLSYALVPFSPDEKVKFLTNYWNALLRQLPHEERLKKFQSICNGVSQFISDKGEVEDFSDFIKQLENITLNSGSDLKERKDIYVPFEIGGVAKRLMEVQYQFAEGMEIITQPPLHLQMTGRLIYEDSFYSRNTLNQSHLYIRFLKFKMSVFTKQKVGTMEHPQTDILMNMGLRMASSMLEKLSANSFLGYDLYSLKRYYMFLALSIGIITENCGTYQFVRQSFKEFFFAKWLLKKAEKEHVTRFWLQKLFLEDWLSGVRHFLEDILHLLSEGVLGWDKEDIFLIQKSSLLNREALPESDTMQGIHKCLYSHVINCQKECLKFLVESFGGQVVRMMLDNQKSGDLCFPAESRIAQEIDESIRLLPNQYTNIFTFATFCLSKLKVVSLKKCIGIIRCMLEMIDKVHLIALMNDMISKNGLQWIFPIHVYFDTCDDEITLAYISEVVTFLKDHMNIFGSSLKQHFYDANMNTFHHIGERDFWSLTSLVESMYKGCNFARFLLEENIVVFELWKKAVWFQSLEVVKCVWEYLEKKLGDEAHRLEYLKRKDEKFSANVLLFSTYNKDPRVVEFVLDSVTTLLKKPGEVKNWLFETFNSKHFNPPSITTQRSFHKFLNTKIKSNILSVEEVTHLLHAKNCHGHCYLLEFPVDSFPNSILSFYDFLRSSIRECAGKIIPNIKCPLALILRWMVTNTRAELEDDLKLSVEQRYKSIISEDKFQLIHPLPQEIFLCFKNLLECKVSAEHFTANIVVLNEKLTHDFHYQDREFVMRQLSYPGYGSDQDHHFHNILHHAVSFKNINVVQHVCGVLMKFITREEMKALFLEVDAHGKTVLQSSMFDGAFYSETLEIVRKILGVSDLLSCEDN